MIKKYDNLIVTDSEEIDVDCLLASKIWYEYYSPDEYIELKKRGFKEEFLDDIFIGSNPNPENHVKYSLLAEDFLGTEFSYIKCAILIKDNLILNGYVFKIKNAINSLTIVHQGESYDFFDRSVFKMENHQEFLKLKTAIEMQPHYQTEKFELEFDPKIQKFFALESEFEF